ncbi:MAG: ParB/RepB/Spo0J family partition protein [Lachnospiraceae bacterium]|nr:ParB/RepB/Spo0J family partition protein [Lachnospiraceae bacterium]
MSERKIDLGLTAYDEMFMTDQERAEAKLPRIYDLSLDQIDDFPDHPFQVRMDEDMDQLVQSIKERGLITPITVRPKDDGRYEIVSGHRRKKACELAEMPTIKAEIREISRDEAIVLMVESNLQRSQILPSEKAFSYKMRLEAMKRLPGRPSKENGVPVGPDFQGKSREVLANESPDSNTQIQRYIRLTELIPQLLQLVDDGKIAMRPAVEISYLTKKEQQMLAEAIDYADCTPSHAQAIRMRAFSQDGTLGPHVIDNILNEEKPNQVEKISLRYKDARRYIPDSIPYNKTGEYIMKALEFYQRYQERQRDGRNAR